MVGTEIHVGCTITIRQHTVHGRARTGRVLAVLGGGGPSRYRVGWDDGTVSVFTPCEYASVDSVVHAPVRSAGQLR